MDYDGKRSIRDILVAPKTGSQEEMMEIRETILQVIDYAIVEAAIIRAPQLVYYLRMARLELEHLEAPE